MAENENAQTQDNQQPQQAGEPQPLFQLPRFPCNAACARNPDAGAAGEPAG